MNKNQNGIKNPNFKFGLYCKDKINYCVDCLKEGIKIKISNGVKRCRQCAGKKHSLLMLGTNNPNFGNPLNMKGESHGRFIDGHYIIINHCPDCGKEIWADAKHCSVCANKDKRNPNYTNGKSNEPYPLEFNDELKLKIRKRDNYQCQKCGVIEKEYKKIYNKNLDVHHIDYDKFNCNETNLITLCSNCNSKVNSNRNYWFAYFTYIMEDRKDRNIKI